MTRFSGRRDGVAMIGLIGAFGLLLTGCGSDDDPPGPPPVPAAVSMITYTYVGASVEPSYHREYTIVVTADEATIRIGTYGTVDGTEDPVGTATAPITEEIWSDLVADTGSLPSEEETDGCSGGSTQKVEVEEDDGVVRKTSVYDCGSGNEEATEQLEELIEPVLDLFDLNELDDRD